MSLSINYNRGFTLKFENGITISVQFGTGNYCNRRILQGDNFKDDLGKTKVEAENAEIAIWDADNKWFSFDGDTVNGWVSANEVANWIYLASTVNNLEELRAMVNKSSAPINL